MVLEKIALNPSQRVLFEPNSTPQYVNLVIDNETDLTVMFKMKSTRPGLYQMRPVYETFAASQKCSVKLLYKGLKKYTPVPISDRFTIVFAVAPRDKVITSTCDEWKHFAELKKIANTETRKIRIAIFYRGVNDNFSFKHDDNDRSVAGRDIFGETRWPLILNINKKDGTNYEQSDKNESFREKISSSNENSDKNPALM